MAELTALADACFMGDIAEVRMLLRPGLNLNVPLPNGDRLLGGVAAMGDARLQILKLLVEHGADVNSPMCGTTVLKEIQGSSYCDNEQTIAYLQSQGAPQA
jgi:hypothetical protein